MFLSKYDLYLAAIILRHDPLVQYEYEEIRSAIEFDKTVAANVGWKSFITKAGNRKRLRIIVAIAFFSQWSGNGLVSYYLNKVFDAIGITDPTIQLLINGILQIWNLGVAILASFLVDRVGRRILFITSCCGMLLFFTLQTICSALFAQHGSPGAAHAVIAFIFLYYAAYEYVYFTSTMHPILKLILLIFSIAFTPLIVSYTVEILPFAIRAKGFNIFNFAISLSLIFNQYVNPIALDHIAWKYYIVYVCWIAFELVYCYLFVIETKNRTLEETAALFDGDEALETIAAHAVHEVHDDKTDEKGSDYSGHALPKV